MSPRRFRPGIDELLGKRRSWFKFARVGLISHPAALDAQGCSSAERLAIADDIELKAIFGPEHGFWGNTPAGKKVRSRKHPHFNVPVYSLYGQQRRPTAAMLKGLDVLVFDIQNLAARPYTYVSTLLNVMEAAADAGIRVIVADRPVALPNCVDGPLPAPGFNSFVAAVDTPMAYGMTPGEVAGWIRTKQNIDVDLCVAKMQGYQREATRQTDWPAWIPPSPQIQGWESAQSYLATIFAEALPAIDNGRGTALAFQVFGAPWMDVNAVQEVLLSARLSGVKFHPHLFTSAHGPYAGKMINALRLAVTSPNLFKPVTTSLFILKALEQVHGQTRTWKTRKPLPDFFDKLYATDSVRKELCTGTAPSILSDQWRHEQRLFRKERQNMLLYRQGTDSA